MKRKAKPLPHWEAWTGTGIVEGKLANGKPRRVLVTTVMVAHTKSDVAIIQRKHPRLRFVEKL